MGSLSSTVARSFDSFIGREEERQAVKTLLSTHRLVTLTGAAGIGKTRLALRIAEELSESIPDGVCFVGLVELTDPALVPQAVASALGAREQPDRPLLQTLTDALATRNLLLVWDNCDYLVEGCRTLAQALLGACPQVKILATSRRSLRFRGEALYTVPPFSIPEVSLIGDREENPAELILTYEAPRLFKERAGEILTGFAIRPEDATTVVQICRRLDGIPLAVELAAARIRELSVQQIASRLDERFHLLTSDASLMTHQQTIWNAIDWSNELLSEAEQTLLARLSVFAGGWDLEAAEQVCSDFGLPTDQNPIHYPKSTIQNADVLDLLTRLIDKSLVVGETGQGVRRYRFLETIREYSRERLAASGDEDELRARHAEYFLKLAEEADAELTRLVRATWLDRLENEYENLRAALAWCLAEETRAETALRLARALARFWEMRGYLSEGRAFLAQALAREGAVGATRARAGALNAAAVLAWMQGDAGTARALFDESLMIERSSGDSSGVAWSLHHLGHVASERGEYETAQGLYGESLAIFRELGNQRGIAVSLADQGNVAVKQGHLDTARSIYEESLRISRELGNQVSVAVALNNLGKIAREQGDDQAARALHTESLLIRRELGDRGGYAWSLEAFARLAAPVDPRRAARLWGAAEALRESLGLPLPPNEREEYERHRSAVREALGQELFADAWSQGRTMTPEQAAESALHESGSQFDRTVADPAPALPPRATKLSPPTLSPSLLPRPRLTARLNRAAPAGGRSARLALLDASPGSGKSSLVSQWYHQQPVGTVAWLALDREDNEPARFLHYLCASIETVAPAATPPVRSLLQAANRTSLEPALTLLMNGVSLLEQPVTLVLDDYHAIEAAPVHQLLAFLVEHLPPTLFLILTTRSDPPLPLARLRLQGQLIEIRDDELRFTHEEAIRFLNEHMGLTLTPEMVKRLADQTEGWIAGLQMAALSLQGEADPASFLEAFAGTNRFLMDYLFEEVLRRQPPEVQAFLGQTAFLDRLCGPLCDAVTGAPGGRAMLQRLAAANLFLVPLDKEEHWYRYHHLFADVLRARLLSSDAEVTAALHGRAAAWYEAEDMFIEAIEHALAAGELARAVRLIERQSREGEPAQVVARLERFLDAMGQRKRHGSSLEARVLLSTLHWEANRREQAVAVLEPALTFAEREGSVHRFLEAGPKLIPVLRQAAVQGITPEFIGKLLAALSEGKHSAGMPPSNGSPALIEPLSEREVEVLRLLAAGLPNKVIAAQLYLAVGTVKRHVFNLYGKLGATSRTSAIARARELGLL